jgi:hypothetical protein
MARPRWCASAGAAALALTLALSCAPSGARDARASCGAESCPLDLRAAHAGNGPFSFGLTWQYVPQDRVRVGTRPGVVGQLASPEDEVRTVSRVTSAVAHVELSRRWRIEATTPFVERSHVHVRNEPGFPPQEMRWDYSGLGDVQLMTDWRASARGSRTTVRLQGGVKLPTGERHTGIMDGEEPEPAARPGTGSWDGLAGVHVMRSASVPTPGGGRAFTPIFLSALGRLNGRGTEEYRVGPELQLGAGSSCPLAGPVTLLAQLNVRLRGRDEPGRTDALAANTGSTAVFLSPGLSFTSPRGASLYGYVQVPLYQRVNRIQIVAPYLLYLGLTLSPAR